MPLTSLSRLRRSRWKVFSSLLAFTTLGAFLAVLSSSVSAWHSCMCDSGKPDNQSAGGDGKPLYWQSAQRLEHSSPGPGTPEYRCYTRTIRNASSDAVTRVVWKVAHFAKNVIPAGESACDALGVQDFVKQESGPIVFGPSGMTQYQTQVWAPHSGWLGRASRAYGDVPIDYFKLSVEPKPLQLSSWLSFFLSATAKPSSVTVNSEVEALKSGIYRYTYRISNHASEPVRVAWAIVTNVPTLYEMRTDTRWNIKSTVAIPGNQTLTFQLSSTESPKWGIGAVRVVGSTGTILTEGIGSSYGPMGAQIGELEAP